MITTVLDFLSQHTGYVGFAIGLFCGVPVGMFVMVWCCAAGNRDYDRMAGSQSTMPRVLKR